MKLTKRITNIDRRLSELGDPPVGSRHWFECNKLVANRRRLAAMWRAKFRGAS